MTTTKTTYRTKPVPTTVTLGLQDLELSEYRLLLHRRHKVERVLASAGDAVLSAARSYLELGVGLPKSRRVIPAGISRLRQWTKSRTTLYQAMLRYLRALFAKMELDRASLPVYTPSLVEPPAAPSARRGAKSPSPGRGA